MIVKWPGVTRPGTEVDVPVISHDVFPTVLEMVSGNGTPSEETALDGISLVPLLTGQGGLEHAEPRPPKDGVRPAASPSAGGST